MFPSKQQWTNWSLPSKLTAISAYLTIGTVSVSIIWFIAELVGGGELPENVDQSEQYSKMAQLLINEAPDQLYVGTEMICAPNDVCRDKIFSLPRVVLISENAPIFYQPDAGTYVDGLTLKTFQRYVVLRSSLGKGSERWFEIGVSTDQPLVWVRENDTLSYDHRISFSAFSSPNRNIPVFKTSEELEAYLAADDLEAGSAGAGLIRSSTGRELRSATLPIRAHREVYSRYGFSINLLQTKLTKPQASSLGIDCDVCNYWLPDRFADGTPITDIYVLLTQEELKTYTESAKELILLLEQAEISPLDFLIASQRLFFLVAQFSSPDTSKEINFDTELITNWFIELPYRVGSTRVLDADILSMSMTQVSQLVETAKEKVSLLDRANFENLNEGALDGFEIYRIPLDGFI